MSNFINNKVIPYIASTEEPAKKERKKQKALLGVSQNKCIINKTFEEALCILRSGIYNKSENSLID